MKSRESKLILIIVILVILLIGMSINLILNPKGILTRTKQIVKEMTETEYDSSITELNKSHTDYARQVQENKRKLAQAISNENVDTSENATVDEMVTNIGKILEARTSDATATADNITEGKTAWVNGKLITGTGSDNNYYYNLGTTEGVKIVNLGVGTTFDLSKYDGYKNFTLEKNFIICSQPQSFSVGVNNNSATQSGTISTSKNYNSTTGILSVSQSLNSYYCFYDNDPKASTTKTTGVQVYLIY